MVEFMIPFFRSTLSKMLISLSAQFVLILLTGCSQDSSTKLQGFVEAQVVSQGLRSYFRQHGYTYFEKADSRRWLNRVREDHPLRTARLTADHIAAIRAYTDGTSRLYREINGALKSDSRVRKGVHMHMVDLLSESLDLLPIDEDLETSRLYRRLPSALIDRYKTYRSGDLLTSVGFTSTSLIDYDILDGDFERSLLLVVDPSSDNTLGREIWMFSAYPHEQEVLFPPGTVFEITDRLIEKDAILYGEPVKDFIIKANAAYGPCK